MAAIGQDLQLQFVGQRDLVAAQAPLLAVEADGGKADISLAGLILDHYI